MEADIIKKELYNKCILDRASLKKLSQFADKCFVRFNQEGKIISTALVKKDSHEEQGLTLLFILDDLNSVVFNHGLVEYQAQLSEIAYSSGISAEIEVMLASVFWDFYKANHENTMNIIRYSLVLKDKSFFLPLQELLITGKRRPSKEAVNVYFLKAKESVKSCDEKLKKSVIDLYWAVTDAAHAAVMVTGISPPSPKELSVILKKELILRKLVNKRCGDVYDRIFEIGKKIMHKEVMVVSGREFDSYLSDSEFFVNEMEHFVEEFVNSKTKNVGVKQR